VSLGILDAPQLGNNEFARCEILIRVDERGACVAVDAAGKSLTEQERLKKYLA
jgi:hypothetical protein